MYLININALELEEFIEGQIPPYAILSHRWGAEELNFKEVLKKRVDKNKRGYRKLTEACRIAANYNVTHLWIDTCCIDKRSSAELSEAINSMFSWYEKAEVCLAYLEDVESGPNLEETFRNSVWFTRAWTLQELLAPAQVDFFTGSWDYFANKQGFTDIITAVTGIPRQALTKDRNLLSFEIAKRISWASNRNATRTEDIAYSLMGIFNINMPLLYGEGIKAFLRLQEEIIRHATELSFLRWGFNIRSHQLLSSSPLDFQDAGQTEFYYGTAQGAPFNLTNFGLEVEITLYRQKLNVYSMKISREGQTEFLLFLQKHILPDTFYRIGISAESNLQTRRWAKRKKVTLLRYAQAGTMKKDINLSERALDTEYGFRVRTDQPLPIQFHNTESCAWSFSVNRYGNPDHFCKFSNPESLSFSSIEYRVGTFSSFHIELFFNFDFIPCALFSRKGVMNVSNILQDISDWEPTERSRTSKYADLELGRLRTEKVLEQLPRAELWRCWGERSVDSYYRIPEHLSYPGPLLRVRFLSPSFAENQSQFWIFQISRLEESSLCLSIWK